ncbi:unnamed protein product [Brassica oleracea var. botrytis]
MSYGGGGATDSFLVKLCVGFTTSLPQIYQDNDETGRISGGVMSSAVQRWWDGGAAVQW